MKDKINRGIGFEEQTPFDTPVARTLPDSSNLYLLLFHGRETPGIHPSDWGFEGPIIGPVGVSWTYGCVKVHAPGWRNMKHLRMASGLIKFKGKYYGDFEVMAEDDPKLVVARKNREVIGFDQLEDH